MKGNSNSNSNSNDSPAQFNPQQRKSRREYSCFVLHGLGSPKQPRCINYAAHPQKQNKKGQMRDDPGYVHCENNGEIKRYSKATFNSVKGKRINQDQVLEIFCHHNIIVDCKHHFVCHECTENRSIKDWIFANVNKIPISQCESSMKTYQYFFSSILSKLNKYKSYYEKENIDLESDEKKESIDDAHAATEPTNRKHNCVKYGRLTDADCKYYCRLSKENIQEIADEYDLKERDVFLFYHVLYHKTVQSIVGLMFGLSQSRISVIINKVRKVLTEEMVPHYLGSNYWTRAKIAENTPRFIKELANVEEDEITFTVDGFPLFIPKSSDFDIQKVTHGGKNAKYSQNHFNIHGMGTGNGYIIDLQGPYGATMYNNDQHIMDSFTDDDYIVDSYDNEDNIYYNKQHNCDFYVERVNSRDKVQQDRGMHFPWLLLTFDCCDMLFVIISLMVAKQNTVQSTAFKYKNPMIKV